FSISAAYLGTIEPRSRPCEWNASGRFLRRSRHSKQQLSDWALSVFNAEVRAKMSASSGNIALFIDGANLYSTAKTLGFDIDYKRLLREFQSRGEVLRAFYYTAVIEDQEFSSIRPLIDWLDYNGFTVVTKATKEYIDANGRRKVKGSMDIELAVD